MNKESKAALINSLNVHGVDGDFKKYVKKYIPNVSYNNYLNDSDSIFVIRRVAQLMTEEDGQDKMLNIADSWEERVLLSGTSIARHLCSRYSSEQIIAAVRRLREQGAWIAPTWSQSYNKDILIMKPLNLIHGAVKKLTKMEIDMEEVKEIQELQDSQKVQDPEMVVENQLELAETVGQEEQKEQEYLPANEHRLSYLREQWRPFGQVTPNSADDRDQYIIMIDTRGKMNTSADIIRGRRIAPAFWINKQWVNKNDVPVLNDNEKVTAWIPFPSMDLYDVDFEELTIPIEVLYGDVKHKYRKLRFNYVKSVNTTNRQKDKINELKEQIANLTEQLENTKVPDYQERISELEDDVLAKAEVIKDKDARIAEYGSVIQKAKEYVDKADAHVQQLEDELDKLRKSPANELPKMRVIPESKLLELPLVGQKLLNVLEPFLKKYNIMIDHNK